VGCSAKPGTAVDHECLRGVMAGLRVILVFLAGPGDREFLAWPSVRFHADQPISDTSLVVMNLFHLHIGLFFLLIAGQWTL